MRNMSNMSYLPNKMNQSILFQLIKCANILFGCLISKWFPE